MNGRDRRKHKRIPFRADIVIDNKMSFRCIDLSKGGLYVYTGRSFEENSIVDVAIPSKNKKINVRAKVRHNQPGIGMGLEFIDLSDDQRAMIEELIESVTGSSVKSGIQKKRVLLIEDDDRTRQINKSKLFSEGFHVIEARDGIEAMKLLEEEAPDCVILDLFMERMDGFKVLAVLKAHPGWENLPVIVFSARGTQDVIEKVINAGADEFLSKMLTSPTKLAEAVKMILRH